MAHFPTGAQVRLAYPGLAASRQALRVVRVSNQSRPKEVLPLLRALFSYLSGSYRLPRLRSVLIALISIALLLPAAPARADAGLADISMGSSSLGSVGADDAWSLVGSSYDLGDVDTISQTLSGPSVGNSLSADYATQADLASSADMALDSAALARQAQAEAEAKRQAALSATAHLKAGAVPAAYSAMVEAADTQYCPRLPLGVLAAQLSLESGWNPKAQSGVGAQGIAQFMPGTWASEGVDGDGDGIKDVWNPADAIPAAAKYDCTLMDLVNDVPGDLISNMLAAYNAGEGAVHKYQGIPPFAETQAYVKNILATADTLVDYASGTGPEGCPTSAPAGTLRENATQYTLSQICADSVAQARTPQAAGAIKYALSHLGVPYSQANRNQDGYFDCSSFVSRSYQAAGVNIAPPGQNAPTTLTFRTASWSHPIALSEARPGDWIEPESGHVYMYLAHNLMVQSPHTGDVTDVMNQSSTSPYAVGWVDPTAV